MKDLINLLIPHAHAVGTLTSSDTQTIVQNWIDEVTANVTGGVVAEFLVAMVVLSIAGWVFHALIRAFTKRRI